MLAAAARCVVRGAPEQLLAPLAQCAGFAAKASASKEVAAPAKVNWKDVKVPDSVKDTPETIGGGQAFPNDLRSTSALGLGDGLINHTAKWLQGNVKTPMQWIKEAPPIKVHGNVVASYGSDNPALGCPVEYINVKGTTKENPAVCKYTGNRYYSDDWKHGAGGADAH